jgi:hypothetical protein
MTRGVLEKMAEEIGVNSRRLIVPRQKEEEFVDILFTLAKFCPVARGNRPRIRPCANPTQVLQALFFYGRNLPATAGSIYPS